MHYITIVSGIAGQPYDNHNW